MTPPASISAAEVRRRVESSLPWREASAAPEAIEAAHDVARNAPQELVDRLDGATRIVITGAGSSLYIAQVAAFAMREEANLPAEAQPLSEVLLRPDPVFASQRVADQPLIVVSRSGTTTEALEVLRAARERGQYTVAVTCRLGAPMAALADVVLAVPEGDDEAIVMTRSFVSQASLLLRLGARLGDPAFAASLDAMPARWSETAPFIEEAYGLAAAAPSRLVVLGAGAAFGIANEAVLKATETGQVPASAFHPLEFRHGPISVCEPGVIVAGVLGGPTEADERRVVEEAAALGATPFVLGSDGPGTDLHPTARLPLALHVLQALAFGVAVERGHDLEAPRHLEQVVVIEDQ
ncbi:MAG: SIS domain-containing protein [Candidatus Limnocylindrales bacterium]